MKCECADRGCPFHTGLDHCVRTATDVLYRCDMEDRTGTRFCRPCADDADESGLYGQRTGVVGR